MEMRQKIKAKLRVLVGMFALALVLGLWANPFSIVSQASQGKITASTTAKIRKEASTSSDTLGSVPKDKVVTINGQVQAADGYVWYQVSVDGIDGYIRSDLVQIVDENVPANEGSSTEVTEVNPISATVHGNTTGTSVRVRKEASTSSSIVANAVDGQELTVLGTANGNDGKVWFQVKFSTGGTDVTGFIRSDYVKLSGELTAPSPQPDTPVEEPPVTEDPGTKEPEVDTVKDFETKEVDGIWYLIDNQNGIKYEIKAGLLDKVTQNADAYNAAAKKVKTQKTIITILILLLIAAAAFIGLLIFKIKGDGDDMYYRPVERDVVRRRVPDRPQGGDRKPAAKAEYGKPLGASGISGQRPGGVRPAGQPEGARPAGQPGGARPAGQPGGARPAGQPGGARPAGQPGGARPAGQPGGARPAEQSGGARTAEQSFEAKTAGQPVPSKPVGQAKNFAVDDDEFEFEFLKYDENDNK